MVTRTNLEIFWALYETAFDDALSVSIRQPALAKIATTMNIAELNWHWRWGR